MKISAVNNLVKRSHFQATKKVTNSIKKETQQRDNKSLGLIILGGIGVASVALYALSQKKPNVVKNVQDTVAKTKTNIKRKVPSKKRGAQAVRQYQYEMNMRKMESLHARLLTDEFKTKTPEVMQKIQRNAINLAKETGCLKV